MAIGPLDLSAFVSLNLIHSTRIYPSRQFFTLYLLIKLADSSFQWPAGEYRALALALLTKFSPKWGLEEPLPVCFHILNSYCHNTAILIDGYLTHLI